MKEKIFLTIRVARQQRMTKSLLYVLKIIIDLKKLVKNNTYLELHTIGEPAVIMRETTAKKEKKKKTMSIIYIKKRIGRCISISFFKKA